MQTSTSDKTVSPWDYRDLKSVLNSKDLNNFLNDHQFMPGTQRDLGVLELGMFEDTSIFENRKYGEKEASKHLWRKIYLEIKLTIGTNSIQQRLKRVKLIRKEVLRKIKNQNIGKISQAENNAETV